MKKTSLRKPVGSLRRPSFLDSLLHKIASLCVLYVALALAFVLPLALTAAKEPAIVAAITRDAPLPFLSAAEASHMHDVYELVSRGMLAASVALLFLVFYGMKKGISRAVFKDALLMSFVLCALLIPFQYTFTWFHAAFFPQGNWQFASDSWLITHFSEQFFFRAAVTWLSAVVLFHAIFMRALPDS